MNANNLADRLEQFYQGTHITKAAETLREQQAEIDRLKSLCISYIDEEWSGTSSYQTKIDEVNNDCK
jgi:predicted aminopeptidase